MATEQAIQRVNQAEAVEALVVQGDLAKLSPEQRVVYYRNVCESLGLNPLTQPFEYLNLNGKLRLYARRDCTDQLRKIHKVSVAIAARERSDDMYVVTARATTPDGRTDESIGAVPIAGLKGENLANALMKGETKAKRRVTLAICGLAILDESELEGVGAPAPEPPPRKPGSGTPTGPLNISPHMHSDEQPGDFNPNEDGDRFHAAALETLSSIEEQIKECADVEGAEAARKRLGSVSAPGQLMREINAARGVLGGPSIIGADQYKELCRVWHKLNRMLERVERDLDPGSAADFLNPPDATGDKTAGPYP